MKASPLRRCAWAGNDPLMQAYHDNEWGVPVRESRALWELLMLEGFQAGLSWAIVLKRREALRRAFRGFDPKRVARFGPRDVARLMQDERIIRSRAKIAATIAGARAYLAMAEAGEDFAEFAWSFVGDQPVRRRGPVPGTTPLAESISAELKRRGFRFVGPVIVYAWMQAAGLVDDHAPDCFRRRANRTRPA